MYHLPKIQSCKNIPEISLIPSAPSFRNSGITFEQLKHRERFTYQNSF